MSGTAEIRRQPDEDLGERISGEQAQAELAAIVRCSDDAIYSRTLNGEITSWNPGAARLYGYAAEEAIGRDVRVLVPPAARDDFEAKVSQLLGDGLVEHFEARHRRKDGSLVDVSVGLSQVRGSDDRVMGISIIARDITDRKRFEAQLQRLADHDPLTSLYNRRRFEEELRGRIAHARRYGSRGAILMLDLDKFKYVNDAFGHSAGDGLLRGVADLLRGRLRETDVLARLGGDEFAVLLPEADVDDAHRVAGDLLESLREYRLPVEGRTVGITTSIGIVAFSSDALNADELMADADRAMYLAKETGRDRAADVQPGDGGKAARARLGWEQRLRHALEHDRFVLYAQPILDLERGEICRHELLLRLEEDDKLIPPGAFLGVAERLDLVTSVDRWVIAEAIRMIARRPDLRLEINLSARSLDDPTLFGTIQAAITEHAIDPRRLVFAVTETAAIGSFDGTNRLATVLHELGCSFALDDFGAGFGSFHYLKHLPVQYVKIDGEFVASPRSKADDLVIDAIVRIARGLGKRTVAEFVEDAATLEMLKAVGVDYAQGYHVGLPVPAAALLQD